MLYIIAVILLYLPMKLLFPTKVIGRKNMPKKGKRCVVTANHYSNIDALIFEVSFMRQFKYMAKKELFKNRFLGWILKSLGVFAVDRQNFGPSDLKKTLKLLKDNKQIMIFPEGTRNKLGSEEMLGVKSGIVIFASKSDSEIVPTILYKKPKIFSRNYIIVGEPFKVKGDIPNKLTKEEISDNIENYTKVMENLRKELNHFVNLERETRNKRAN